jgi:hypothetical protein
MKSIRNRIVEHVVVRAGDLVPHPLNYRRHPARQREALAASYEEIGFARSLLGYRLPDGRIQLIDGHLRRDLAPDLEVTVEVLDVTEEEARKLLLSIDPLAALAETDTAVVRELTALTQADAQILNDLWRRLAEQSEPPPLGEDVKPPPEQYLILVACKDEAHQVELLNQFQNAGLKCKALLS